MNPVGIGNTAYRVLTPYYRPATYNDPIGAARAASCTRGKNMKAWLAGVAVLGAAGLTGCAVYPAPYEAGVAVAPAPVVVAPAPVVVAPRPYYGPYYRPYPYRGGHYRGHRHWH